jgi:DNA uptake protein ComE-like DNA-binding protein
MAFGARLRLHLIVAGALLGCTLSLAQTGSGSGSQGSSSGAQESTPKARKRRPAGTLPASDRLDINAASKKQLIALGLDEGTADKIIAGRPYRTKRDLLTRGVVSESTYEDIKGQIIAHREGTAPSKKKKPSDDLRVPQ